MNGPSPHLSWPELACRDRVRTPYPLDWRDSRAVVLAGAFEALRARIGGVPLAVLSAYRTPAHNRAVGGAKDSQHVQGRALDLRPPDGWTPIELAAVAQDIPAIRGIGVYATFLHIDVRDAAHLVVWNDREDRKAAGRPCLSFDELGQYVNQLVNDARETNRTADTA